MGTEATALGLGSTGTIFSIQWYDPRNGGPMVAGSLNQLKAKGKANLGSPPKEFHKDWIAMVQAIKS